MFFERPPPQNGLSCWFPSTANQKDYPPPPDRPTYMAYYTSPKRGNRKPTQMANGLFGHSGHARRTNHHEQSCPPRVVLYLCLYLRGGSSAFTICSQVGFHRPYLFHVNTALPTATSLCFDSRGQGHRMSIMRAGVDHARATMPIVATCRASMTSRPAEARMEGI